MEYDHGAAAEEPLIRDGSPDDNNDSIHAAVDQGAHDAERELERPSAFVWTLTFAAGISGLLFGYE